jgi:Kdo2-lipid IVA lauroyltransferase/acyltransferase
MRHEVPVIVGYGRRTAKNFQFEIGIQQIIEPSEWADKDDPMTWLTQEYTKALEDSIRTAPEQYLWVHRRWKHRPKGEPPAPDGIA